MLKKYLYELIVLYFRLLYSPISIRQEINDLTRKSNQPNINKNQFLFRTILIQIWLIISISFVIILCLFILNHFFKYQEFHKYIETYGIGAGIGLLSILFFTWVFFIISNKDLLNLSFLRSLTRLWLFTIGGGLMLLLFYLVRNANNDYTQLFAIFFISFTLGFITQKAYQLMSITNAMDNDIFNDKKSVLKESKNYKNQVAAIVIIMLLDISIILIDAIFEKPNYTFYLILLFGISFGFGFLSSIYSYPIGYFLIFKPIFLVFKPFNSKY